MKKAIYLKKGRPHAASLSHLSYLAYSMALVSRTTVTRICPG